MHNYRSVLSQFHFKLSGPLVKTKTIAFSPVCFLTNCFDHLQFLKKGAVVSHPAKMQFLQE